MMVYNWGSWLFVIRDHVIACNTWNYKFVYKLLVIDMNTWSNITMCKRIIIIIIIIIMKPYNCL